MPVRDQQTAANLTLAPRCLALVLHRTSNSAEAEKGDHYTNPMKTEREVFREFIDVNKTCYWNPHLRESVENLRFAGFFLEPLCLLLTGRDIYLDTVQTAWSRKVLRPPPEFVIETVGEIDDLDVKVTDQVPFTPLPDVLCMIISDCNSVHVCATFDIILAQLDEHYPNIQLPSETFVYATLDQLLKERKIYHSGSGYFIVTPDTFQVNGCITVRDDHIIIGNTGGHGSGIPAIYIPLLAMAKAVTSEQKTISCQTETNANDEAKVKEESTEAQGKDKALNSKLLRASSLRKSKQEKTGVAQGTSNQTGNSELARSASTNTPSSKNLDERKSLLKRILGKSKKCDDGDGLSPTTECLACGASQPENTTTLKPKSCAETHQNVKAIVSDQSSEKISSNCLGFKLRRKSAKDEGNVQRDLKSDRRPQRSRSMSPNSRTSSPSLSVDKPPLKHQSRSERLRRRTFEIAPPERKLDVNRDNIPIKTFEPANCQDLKSIESLCNVSDCPVSSKSFELELAEPQQVVVKTRKSVNRRFPDSRDYISRIYRRYNKMKRSSQDKSPCRSRPFPHANRILLQNGEVYHHTNRFESHEDFDDAQALQPFESRDVSLAEAKDPDAHEILHQLIEGLEISTAEPEDSGFLSIRAVPNPSREINTKAPAYLPTAVENLSAYATASTNHFLPQKAAESKAFRISPQGNAAANSERRFQQDLPSGESVSLLNSKVIGKELPPVDSCQTGSSWPASRRHTTFVELQSHHDRHDCSRQNVGNCVEQSSGSLQNGHQHKESSLSYFSHSNALAALPNSFPHNLEDSSADVNNYAVASNALSAASLSSGRPSNQEQSCLGILACNSHAEPVRPRKSFRKCTD